MVSVTALLVYASWAVVTSCVIKSKFVFAVANARSASESAWVALASSCCPATRAALASSNVCASAGEAINRGDRAKNIVSIEYVNFFIFPVLLC